MHLLAEEIVEVIQDVVPADCRPAQLHEPSFSDRDRELVMDCINSGFVSSVGRYVDEFELQLAEYLGVKHVVAVVNGTAALHLCLKLVGVESNDEVIMPSLTFVATANAAHYCGAVPHFVDVDEVTLGISPSKLDSYLSQLLEKREIGWVNRHSGRRVSAVIPVHTFGHPVDMDALNEVAEGYDIAVVEDAAESLGSRYRGRMAGSLSTLAAISFNGNKIITTGGGGAIATNDTDIAKRAKHLSTTAKEPHCWAFRHDEIGFNYRMPNLNAALGCAQLEKMSGFLEMKRNLASKYKARFDGVEGVRFVSEPCFAKSNYWLNSLLIDDSMSHQRDDILRLTNKSGLMTRPVWTLMHRLPIYAECPRMNDMSVSESIEGRLITIPSSPFLFGRLL